MSGDTLVWGYFAGDIMYGAPCLGSWSRKDTKESFAYFKSRRTVLDYWPFLNDSDKSFMKIIDIFLALALL